jgi:hypothetical protein
MGSRASKRDRSRTAAGRSPRPRLTRHLIDNRSRTCASLCTKRKDGASHVIRKPLGSKRMTNEIHAHHQIDPIERRPDLGRVLRVPSRPHLARQKIRRLLGIEGSDEHTTTIGAPGLQTTCDLDEDRDRRGVVICAGVEALRITAEVIVVSSDEHPAIDITRQRSDEIRTSRSTNRLLGRIEPSVAKCITHETTRANTTGCPRGASRTSGRTEVVDQVAQNGWLATYRSRRRATSRKMLGLPMFFPKGLTHHAVAAITSRKNAWLANVLSEGTYTPRRRGDHVLKKCLACQCSFRGDLHTTPSRRSRPEKMLGLPMFFPKGLTRFVSCDAAHQLARTRLGHAALSHRRRLTQQRAALAIMSIKRDESAHDLLKILLGLTELAWRCWWCGCRCRC